MYSRQSYASFANLISNTGKMELKHNVMGIVPVVSQVANERSGAHGKRILNPTHSANRQSDAFAKEKPDSKNLWDMLDCSNRMAC